jgi:hypothetical protein
VLDRATLKPIGVVGATNRVAMTPVGIAQQTTTPKVCECHKKQTNTVGILAYYFTYIFAFCMRKFRLIYEDPHNLIFSLYVTAKFLYNIFFFLSTPTGVSIYVLAGNNVRDVALRADRPKKIVKVTLCVWLYVAANTTKGTVLSFGKKLRLKIYFENLYNFAVNFHNWNR